MASHASRVVSLKTDSGERNLWLSGKTDETHPDKCGISQAEETENSTNIVNV